MGSKGKEKEMIHIHGEAWITIIVILQNDAIMAGLGKAWRGGAWQGMAWQG